MNKIRKIIREVINQNETDELERLRSDKFQGINTILEHDLPMAIKAELDLMNTPNEKREFIEQLKKIDMQLNVTELLVPGSRQRVNLKVKIY